MVGNSYFADPDRIAKGIQLIKELEGSVYEIEGRTGSLLSASRDWAGPPEDSFSKELGKQAREEDKVIVGTLGALREAVVGTAKGTFEVWRSIGDTQENIIGSINGSNGGGTKKH
ncbi:hypothetical protein ACIRQP_21335 [Streptomyces sp. NPDC102274]|uniref:hypothetical protein n=1 Tax=Streptomyces sp. NPDC102274 TaxID=3366151 RepID=UPI0038121A90